MAGLTRRRRGFAAAALTAAAAVVAAVLIATSSSGSSNAAESSPTSSTATTTIKRQDLVERDSEDGTLGYADSRDVVNHLSGLITWLPSQGAVVGVNHSLYRVDGAPVVLLDGTSPAFRTLGPSTSRGHDVGQLEHNLRRLGYDHGHAMTVDGTWDSGTTAAVERWQDDHGLSQTGSIELGRIVFQPGPRRIATIDATLGGSTSAGGSGGASSASSAPASTTASSTSATSAASSVTSTAATRQLAAYTPSSSSGAVAHAATFRVATAHAAMADRQTTTTDTTTTDTTTTDTTTTTTPTTTTTTPTTTTTIPTTTTPTTTTPTTTTPKPTTTTPTTTTPTPAASGARPTAIAAAAGTGGGGGGSGSGAASTAASSTTSNTIMTTTSTRKVVTVDLATTKSSLAKLGARVTVELPSGKIVHGRLAAVGKVATAASSDSSSSSSSATIALTITLTTRGSALDQAPVTVSFEQSRVKDALAIPVTALLARPGGKFAVEIVDGSSRRLVAVTPGVYTSGFVQITGAGLQPGQSVTNAAVR